MAVTILAYHGVSDSPSHGIENFQKKHLPAEIFERQMRALADSGRVLSLSDAVNAWAAGGDPDGFVVTFDDAKTGLDAIAAASANAGYPARPVRKGG